MKPSTKTLIKTYRRLLLEGRSAEARVLLEENRDNEFLTSLVEFGEALVSTLVKRLQGPRPAP